MNLFKSKRYVRVSSMSNLINQVKTLLGFMFNVRLLQAKNRVLEFDHQYLDEHVRVPSMFKK